MAALRPVLPKLALPLAVFASVLGLLWFVNRPSSVVAPDTGADLGAPGGSTGERIADLQRAVRDDPGDAGLFSMLGDAYLEEARQSGDPSFYARAERSFDAALRRDPGEVTALVGAGALANARHDFRRGLRLGLEARRLAPELVRPLTVVADAQVELGRYAAAANTVQRMLDLKPTLAAYARASYLRELTGDLRGAIEAMRLAVSAGAGAAGDQAYVATLLGDLEPIPVATASSFVAPRSRCSLIRAITSTA